MRVFPPTTHDTPDAIVVFLPTYLETADDYILNHRSQGLFAFSRETVFQDRSIDASILAITTKAQINGFGVNNFSLILIARQDEFGYFWDEKVYPNDVVVIMAKRPSVDARYRTLMIGFVQQIHRVSSINEGGVPSRTIEISGLDLTGFFNSQYIVTDMSLLPIINEIRNQGLTTAKITVSYLGEVLKQLCAPVDEAFKTFMDSYAFKDLRWLLYNDGTQVAQTFTYSPFMDSLKVKPKSNKLKINGLAYSSSNGSVTSFVDTLLQKPFNEILMYYKDFTRLPQGKTESMVGKLEILIRPSPFVFDPSHSPVAQTLPEKCGEVLGPDEVTEDGEYLVTNQVEQTFPIFYHYLSDEDVVSDSLGRSMDNTYTLFFVIPRTPYNQDIATTINAKPGYYLKTIRRYGLKPLSIQTDYTALGNVEGFSGSYEGQKKAMNETQDMLSHTLSSILKQWYVKNAEFISGVLEVKGTGKYRPGDVLIFDSDERRCVIKLYIERVVHKFVNFKSFTTELYLSRGVVVRNKRGIEV